MVIGVVFGTLLGADRFGFGFGQRVHQIFPQEGHELVLGSVLRTRVCVENCCCAMVCCIGVCCIGVC